MVELLIIACLVGEHPGWQVCGWRCGPAGA